MPREDYSLVSDSEYVGNQAYVPEETWCPECGSPPSDRASAVYCSAHQDLSPGGDMDRIFDENFYLSGSGDVDGLSNRKMCDFFHRQKET